MSTASLALDSGQIGKLAVGVIVGLVVLGVLVGLVLTAIISRLIILVIVVLLGLLVWQQRSTIEDHVKNCNLTMSFFGATVHAPADVVQRCRNYRS